MLLLEKEDLMCFQRRKGGLLVRVYGEGEVKNDFTGKARNLAWRFINGKRPEAKKSWLSFWPWLMMKALKTLYN